MSDILIKFDGVQGESTVADHNGWIEISSFSEGLSSPSSASSGTGSSAGKSTLHDFNFVAKEGAHTTEIIKQGTGGKHFPKVEVHYLKQTGAGTPEKYRSCEINEVYITSWTASRSEGSEGFESFSMSGVKAKWEYFKQGPEGGLVSAGSVTYDQKTATTT